MSNKISTYFRETQTEMKRVTWPSRAETMRFTALVVSVSVGVALFLGALDFGFVRLLEVFIF
ncbi:MAG: preprotein translocase subunit SecE [Candidatus Ryanbacteria bacterium RIFCSPHIGHO2_02_FULL_48_12]|uniref:Protein translocase subunit SecE n=1 Tax=Candidatus Ryanbacteria bacterium RIFCSPHIGHO2_01_FULL_48_27 TaxID=1802115 RepID=A0A1G2G7A4_9BACT|nr:MAG: preprotein translocase subunit SecE [Candidatus Ryanbacteria bacterium RIFCSPHIGHO2_01_FULL_48_27]OGZ49451.1 MAG: preprotein translocase subunit SecE [Candidatus Ryanbacteria bacterium RIFCSPHIGHO2_02_FULL_48_12]